MHRARRILVTGGCGFIGSNFIRTALSDDSSLEIVNIDALTYAGTRASLADVERDYSSRYRFVHGSICDAPLVRDALDGCDTVVNFAAESHVDRSIDGPAAFVETNVRGTYVLLEAARSAWNDANDVRFHQVSTDEVYGSLGAEGLFTEDTRFAPSSPYSATKASADHLVRAWHATYGLPVTTSNCSNNYGPYQHPEKLIPLMIQKGLRGDPLPVYGDGRNVRDWLHVDDHNAAILTILREGKDGRDYLIGARNERTNLEVVHLLCDRLDELVPTDASRRELITMVTDRPGHDRRYAIDPTRIQTELGWTPAHSFEAGLRATVQWYLDHEEWVRAALKDGYSLERLG